MELELIKSNPTDYTKSPKQKETCGRCRKQGEKINLKAFLSQKCGQNIKKGWDNRCDTKFF
jgi:hypothetical protein